MRVEVVRAGGIIRDVALIDGDGIPVRLVCRFLRHILDSDGSPNTASAYGYDLKYLFTFFAEAGIEWEAFSPAVAMEFLSWMRTRPSRRPAQRLGLAATVPGGRSLAPATLARVLATVSSFYAWAAVVEDFVGANPMNGRRDEALGRVPDPHQPFAGGASRQQPTRRDVRVKLPMRLPRPLSDEDVAEVVASMKCSRDLAMVLLMLDGGLRPGEVLGLHLEDISYGRRRVTIRKRDDHPGGARGKSRSERVVDVMDPRTLDAVNHYVLAERPRDSASVFLFLVGGSGLRAAEPLSYSALVRMFSRRLDELGIRSPEKTPHALRHTHATALWEGGMRELALQRRLGHASPESTRIYTRVSDAQVRDEYAAAMAGAR